MSAQAQTSKLYLTDFSGSGNISVVQGGSIVQTIVGNASNASALAVGSTIHTLGYQNFVPGQQFSLAGAPIGSPYYRAPSGETFEGFYDGTTDGTYNYAVGFGGGTVFRSALDWSNPTSLFNARPGTIGITYDRQGNALWIADYSGGTNRVTQYTLGGSFVSEFSISSTVVSSLIGLAFDAADQTLWAVGDNFSGQITQFSRTGTMLSSRDLGTQRWRGAEFGDVTATPEPAGVILVATGLLGIFAVRRKRVQR